MLTITDIKNLASMISDAQYNIYHNSEEPLEDDLFIFKKLLHIYVDIEHNIINNGIILSDAELMLELINRALFIYNLEPEMLEKKDEKNPDYPSESEEHHTKHICARCEHDNIIDEDLYCPNCAAGFEDNFEEKKD